MERKNILLTPSVAEKILQKNYAENRRINKSWVNQLASDMSSGRWNEDISEYDQPLSFTIDGTLINGQHRCLAVIKSGKTIRTWANYGVPMRLYEFMDGGKVRSTNDYANVPNSKGVSTLAKQQCAIEDGDATLYSSINGVMKYVSGKESIRVTRSQVLEKIRDNNDYLQMIYSYGQRSSKYFGNKTGAIAAALLTIDFVGNGCLLPEFVDACSKIKTNSDAILACRAYMTQRICSKSFNVTPQWVMGCMFCTYDNFVNDSEIGSFNKVDNYFKKYDALVTKARNERRNKK